MHNIKAKVFALLMAVCMVASYMPTYTFAAEADDPVLTQFTVEGVTDGNVLKAVNENGETDLTVDKTGEKTDSVVNEVEGEKLTLSYEVAEGSTLHLKANGVAEDLEDKVFESGEKGSIELNGGGSVEAKFETPEPVAEEPSVGKEVQEEPKEEVKEEPKEETKETPKEEPSKEETQKKDVKVQPKEEEPYDPEHPSGERLRLLVEERIKAYGTEGLVYDSRGNFLLKAIPSGTTANYTSHNWIFENPDPDMNDRGVRRFVTTVDGHHYEGSCAQAGIEAQSSGTATLTRRSNTSRVAKMIYYFVYVRKWWTESPEASVSSLIPGVDSDWYLPRALFVETIAQCCEMGPDAFVQGYTDNQFPTPYFVAISNYIMTFDISNINVPDGFELYYGNAGSGNQNFVVWTYNPYGKCKVKKVKSPTSAPYSISGADYWVYTDKGCTTRAKDTGGNAIVLTTNASGDTKEVNLTPGKTYYIKEKTAPAHYNLDTTVHSVTIAAGQTKTVTSTDTAKYGYMQVVKKADPAFLAEENPKDYGLAGAVYGVYTNSAATTAAKDKDGKVVTLTTKADGTTEVSPAMWIGTYYIKEKKAPANYKLDTKVYTVKVTDSNTKSAPAKATSTDKVQESYVHLVKEAKETNTKYRDIAPANYSLEGAEYSIVDADTEEDAIDFNQKPVKFVTDKDGKTNPSTILPGVYKAKETKASKGFKIDSKISQDELVVSAKNTKDNPAKFTSVEEPVYVPFNFVVEKREPSGDMGWKKLLGAKYEMKYYPVDPDTPLENLKEEDAIRTWIFETKPKEVSGRKFAGIETAVDDPLEGSDPFFIDEVNEKDARVLPLGVITIQEIVAPPGLAVNEKVYVGRVFQPSNGADAEMEVDGVKIDVSNDKAPMVEVVVNDDRQYPTIKIRKVSGVTKEAKPDGTERTDKDGNPIETTVKGSLAGAVYEVWFENPLTNKNEKVGELVTDENGIGRDKDGNDGIWTRQENGGVGQNKLEMGRYFVKEVTASPGYAVDALYYETNKDGSVNGEGEHIVVARSKEINANTIEYKVDSLESPHHTIIHKTDVATGKELEGAKLQVLDSKGNVIEEWTSGKEPHDIVALHDETQGLKDGKYTLREITAPYGYDVAEDVEFEVSSGAIKNTVEMKNAPIELRTTATSEATGTHVGTFSSEEKIKDVVKFKNLFAGREYTFKGVLMDKETGKELLDKDGNKVTAEKKYTPQGEKGALVSGEVELEFTFDASAFEKERSIVAFEKVERERKELATHSDLEDEDQTVHYGGIVKTTAVDKESKSHNVLAGENAVIVDTVEFKNLAPGETYVLTGELYDKTTGELTGVTASKTFVPEAADGTVDVEFTIDASKLEAHTLVAYEHLAIKATVDGEEKEVPIDDHENPDDEDQTIHIPKFRTTAEDTTTENHIAMAKKDVVIKDTVKYENLIPGKEYTVKGKMVYKDNGNDVLIDGEGVTAEAVFTPEDYNGEVVLEFKFDAVTLAGKSIVAFEEVYEEFLVGVHADLEDEEQTVHIPKIGTTAIDTGTGDHVAALSERNTVVDTVAYENLIPGKEYVMKGVLMSKESGEPVMENGEQVTSELRFTPEKADGTVDLEFTVSPDNLRGGALVAFEDLFFIKGAVDDNPDDEDVPEEEEVLVAEHKDIDDEDQTVYVPEIGTTLTDSETGEHIANGAESVTLIDTVDFRGLTPGKTYVMEGTLMNKKTGKPVLVGGNPLVVDKEFTPEESEGSVEIEFTFDGAALRGETVVAFETCFFENIPVAIHADIEDEEQSVQIPKIGTKIGKQSGKYVIDMVEYHNLIPGREYVMTGFFVDQKTGKKIKDSDSEKRFTPEKADGFVEMKLKPGEGRNKMVAFEYCYIVSEDGSEGHLVGSHEDINDKDQTFTPTPKTGDNNNVYIYGGILLAAVILIAGFMFGKKKKAKKEEGKDE